MLWALRNVFVGVKSQEQRMQKYVTRPLISYTNANASATPEEDEAVMVEEASHSNAEQDKNIACHGRYLEYCCCWYCEPSFNRCKDFRYFSLTDDPPI